MQQAEGENEEEARGIATTNSSSCKQYFPLFIFRYLIGDYKGENKWPKSGRKGASRGKLTELVTCLGLLAVEPQSNIQQCCIAKPIWSTLIKQTIDQSKLSAIDMTSKTTIPLASSKNNPLLTIILFHGKNRSRKVHSSVSPLFKRY